MYTVSNFKFNLDKYRILNTVQSYCSMPSLEETSKMYDELIPILQKSSKPFGIYKITDKPSFLDINMLNNCAYITYCAVTIGEEPTTIINKLFEEGKFYEAIILDAMTNAYLFDISSQFFLKLCQTASSKNLGLTCKIAPGDGDLDLSFQKNIIDALGDSSFHGMHINSSSMLYPAKSMSYIYGIDESIPLTFHDHCCDNCPNINCCMRNTSDNQLNVSVAV